MSLNLFTFPIAFVNSSSFFFIPAVGQCHLPDPSSQKPNECCSANGENVLHCLHQDHPNPESCWAPAPGSDVENEGSSKETLD
jgi:hypothetical protein